MSRWPLALAFALLLGCDSGSKGDCVVAPYPEACCCSGDVLDYPFCAGDELSCRKGMGLHHGDECRCLPDRNTPCCLPHAGYDAGRDTADTATDAGDIPSCPTNGTLPTAGATCDPDLMPSGSFCRLGSCAWGGEAECSCDAGVWKCTMSARDGYGCGTPPRCFEPGSPVCTGTNEEGACLDGKVPVYGQGPWDDGKTCWPTTRLFFACTSATDAPGPLVCFKYSGKFYLGPLVPTGAGALPCTDAEKAAHAPENRCE